MNDKAGNIFTDKMFGWFVTVLVLVVVWVSLDLPMVVNAAKYAQVSREILKSGDWINLTIAGDAYDQKPPLLFWTGAVFFRIFGISTPVWKIAVFLVSLLGIYSTYELGKLLYGPVTGRLSAIFWACGLGYLYYHNDIHTDTLLADMVIFSIWQLALFFSGRKSVHFYLGIFGVGLAMLSKGPVGMAIPATAVGIHLLLHRKWKAIFHPRWIPAALMVGIMIIPAMVGLYNQFGIEGIKFYFWTNNMGRITGSYYVQNPDPFFFFHTSLYMLAPFTVFALGGLYIALKKAILAKGRYASGQEFYTLGGILPYMLVLTFSKTKNPHYMMAVIPLFMILAADFAVSLSGDFFSQRVKKVISCLNSVIVFLFWILIGLFVFWFFPENDLRYWLWIALFVGMVLYSILRYQGVSRQIALLSFSLLAFMFSLNYSFYPRAAKYHAPFQVARDYAAYATAEEQIHLYLKPSRYWEIFFYAKNPGKYFPEEKDLPALLRETNDWVFTDTKGKDQIMKSLPETKIVREYHHRSLSQLTPPFLNPATRASKLEKRYLLHLP